MQVEESTRYFEGCKWISKAGLSLLLTSGDESVQFSQHISSKAIRSFIFKKKCGVSLPIISVVPLWLNILISYFCALKIFHLIYNL